MSSDKRPPPSFVFVDNATERMQILRRVVPPAADERPIPGTPPPQESTMVGRGLNYVRADFVAANPDLSEYGLTLVDPTKIADGAVAQALHRCTSRQAMHAWAACEKRPKVIDQIKTRLEKGPSKTADESEES